MDHISRELTRAMSEIESLNKEQTGYDSRYKHLQETLRGQSTLLAEKNSTVEECMVEQQKELEHLSKLYKSSTLWQGAGGSSTGQDSSEDIEPRPYRASVPRENPYARLDSQEALHER